MQTRRLVVSAVRAAVFLLAVMPHGTAATADCLATPDRAPQDGQHWYFRTDRQTNQKCWYLREHDVTTTGSVAGGPRVAPDAVQRPEMSASTESAQKALFRDFLRWYKERGGTQ
jgi:hypothetical protein